MVGSGAGRQTRPRQVRGRHLSPDVDHSLFGNDALVKRMQTQSPPMAVRNVAPAASRPSRSIRLLPLSQGAVRPSASWTRTPTLLVEVMTTSALSFARSLPAAVVMAEARSTPLAIRTKHEARELMRTTLASRSGAGRGRRRALRKLKAGVR
jgi:hypothetical protein